MQVKLTLLRKRLVNFWDRVQNRLQFFPLTLLFVMFNAVVRAVQLRLGHGLVRVGEVTGEGVSLPRNVILWLGHALAGSRGQQYDICLRLPRDATNHSLHDVFSVLLAFPGFQSICLYWDSSSLADDLPLLQAKKDRNDPAVSSTPYEDLDSLGIRQLEQFLRAGHAEIALPVAATRDAQTLLKRQAAGAYAVCMNVPVDLCSMADAVARGRPDIQFFDLSPAPSQVEKTANYQSLFSHGFTLHERMALIQAADAYLGSFDELGCIALVSGRPAILLGDGTGSHPERVSRDEAAVWFPGATEPSALAKAALQFLSRHSRVAG